MTDFRRVLEKIIIDLDSLDESFWQEISDSFQDIQLERGGLVDCFFELAKRFVDDGELVRGRIFCLLGDVSLMGLRPDSRNRPFVPNVIWDGRRSFIPDDFSENDLEVFDRVCRTTNNIWLKGRLADVLWLVKKPKNFEYALVAIDSYSSLPLSVDTWYSDVSNCWERAIVLAMMLRDGASDRLERIEKEMLHAILSASENDSWVGSLARCMDTYSLGNRYAETIAVKLSDIASIQAKSHDYLGASETLDLANKWFNKANMQDHAIRSTVGAAEMLVENAVMRKEKHDDDGVAAHFYEKAIQKYRSIPKAYRETFQVGERINKLLLLMQESAQQFAINMSIVTTPSINISEACNKARAFVEGKKTLDALSALANIHSGVDIDNLKDMTERNMQSSSFLSLVTSFQVSKDGRTIAKTKSVSQDDDESLENALHGQMLQNFKIRVGLAVEGMILPALRAVRMEHRLSEAEFLHLARYSPIVPEGREVLFAKGLFFGYDDDFITALHLLSPQIENMVRWYLKANSIQTSTLDNTGIEMENGLSTLMKLPEVEGIFGENLAFELRALFCDVSGVNLRNELAHGLLSSDDCDSVYAVYAWWLSFRLIFNSYCHAVFQSEKVNGSMAA